MAKGNRQQATETLLMALACGATVAQAAAKTGISERTIYRRLNDPAFRQDLKNRRAEIVQRTSAMTTAAGLESVKTLMELMNPAAPASVRLGAARSILDLGMRLREVTELEERLSSLEERVEPRPDMPNRS